MYSIIPIFNFVDYRKDQTGNVLPESHIYKNVHIEDPWFQTGNQRGLPRLNENADYVIVEIGTEETYAIMCNVLSE